VNQSGQGAGLLEGALEAARRVYDALAPTERPDTQPSNAGSIAHFQAWVTSQRDATFDSYRRRLDRGRALHPTAPVTQQAILGAIGELYSNALGLLFDLPFDTEGVSVEHGRSALTPLVQAPFRAFVQSFLDDVTAFNRTSHSLAGFTDEQILSHEYLQAILREITDAWRSFSLTANRLLLAKAGIPRVG
jgi:monoamine oxidase